MRFKKIYIEITNICNLNCPFCKKENREKEYMTVDNFKIIINKIKTYTKEIYLHVKGEPLMHPHLKELLKICEENDILVNITTNGTLLKDKLNIILSSKCIRQINISLHSNLNNEKYLNDIFYSQEQINTNTHIFLNYRLWNMQEETNIVNIINNHYHKDITKTNIINDHLFIELEHPFNWPTLDNDYYNENGKCYGLINQVAILVNGNVTPCCLDSESIIYLGNIYNTNFEDIINSERAKKIIENFRNNKKYEELCKHCNFLNCRNKE